jgi:MYXO-CTERM domain-containing protein
MSRLLTFISTMGPTLAIVFVVASPSTALATTYDLTLTQNYGNFGNGSGTITFGETLSNGTNEPFTGDDDIIITIGGLTFGPVTLFTDTADVTNGKVTGIAVGNLPSYFDGSYFTELELQDGRYNSYSITYDNIQIAGGNYSLSLPAPPPPTVTPLPSSISLILGGAGVLGLALLLARRTRREHYDASESFSAA